LCSSAASPVAAEKPMATESGRWSLRSTAYQSRTSAVALGRAAP